MTFPADQTVPFSRERRHDGAVCLCSSGDIKALSTVYWPFCSFLDDGPISQQSAAGRRTQQSGTFKWHLKFSCVKLNCLTGSPPQTADLQVDPICNQSWLKTFVFQIQPAGVRFPHGRAGENRVVVGVVSATCADPSLTADTGVATTHFQFCSIFTISDYIDDDDHHDDDDDANNNYLYITCPTRWFVAVFEFPYMNSKYAKNNSSITIDLQI